MQYNQNFPGKEGKNAPKSLSSNCEMPHELVFGQKIKIPTIVRQAANWARRQARILFTAWQLKFSEQEKPRAV